MGTKTLRGLPISVHSTPGGGSVGSFPFPLPASVQGDVIAWFRPDQKMFQEVARQNAPTLQGEDLQAWDDRRTEGAAALDEATNFPIYDLTRFASGAGFFDGVNDRLQESDNSVLDHDGSVERTYIAVFQADNPPGTGTFVAKEASPANETGWEFGVTAAGTLFLSYLNKPTGFFDVRPLSSINTTDGIPYCVAASHDGSLAGAGTDFWINGIRDAKTIVVDTLAGSISNTDFLTIGAHGSGGDIKQFFNGAIAQIIVVKRLLTDLEHQQVYDAIAAFHAELPVLPLTSNISVHLRGYQNVWQDTLKATEAGADTDPVARVDNATGPKIVLTQATPANQPEIERGAAGITRRANVQHISANQEVLIAQDTTKGELDPFSPLTVAFYASNDIGVGSNAILFSKYDLAGSKGYAFGLNGNDPTFFFQGTGGTLQIRLAGLANMPAGTYIYTLDGSGTVAGVTAYFDNSSEAITTVTDTLAGSVTHNEPFIIGGLTPTVNLWQGQWGEIILLPGIEASPAQVALLHDYLRKQHGRP